MIKDMKSRTIVGNCRSEKFFGVDVHRGSVLAPLLLIVMQEALITEFRTDFVVTCWERADLLALVCGVFCEFVTFPLVSWVGCGA